MPLSPLPFREVKRRLEAAGFVEVSQRGSHVKFARETDAGMRTAVVPRHREIAVGTLRSILRQAGLSADEFEELWVQSEAGDVRRDGRLGLFATANGKRHVAGRQLDGVPPFRFGGWLRG